MRDKKEYALKVLKYGDEHYPNQITTLLIHALENHNLSGEDICSMLNNENSEAYGKVSILLTKAAFIVPDGILKKFPLYYRDVEEKMKKEESLASEARIIHALMHNRPLGAIAG